MEIESEQGSSLTAVDSGDFNFKDKVFSLENVQECQGLVDNPPDCLKYLGEILGLTNYVTTARQAFVVDYFHGINQFVSETKLKAEQGLLVFNFGKDLLCTMLDGTSFEETELFFKTKVVSWNDELLETNAKLIFSLVDMRKLVDFFVGTFFQHFKLYNYCFTKECYTIKRRDVVDVETIFIPPLAEALSKEEVEAQELAVKEALEAAEEKARQEAAAKAEAERQATEEARRLEESKKKPRNLEEAIDFIVREKLEEFRKSFLAECGAEQSKVLDKLQLVEGGSENKPRKR